MSVEFHHSSFLAVSRTLDTWHRAIDLCLFYPFLSFYRRSPCLSAPSIPPRLCFFRFPSAFRAARTRECNKRRGVFIRAVKWHSVSYCRGTSILVFAAWLDGRVNPWSRNTTARWNFRDSLSNGRQRWLGEKKTKKIAEWKNADGSGGRGLEMKRSIRSARIAISSGLIRQTGRETRRAGVWMFHYRAAKTIFPCVIAFLWRISWIVFFMRQQGGRDLIVMNYCGQGRIPGDRKMLTNIETRRQICI